MSPRLLQQEDPFMADPFDIFEVDTKEAVRWLGAAATLTEAQATIRRNGVDLSARYIVVDQKTGKKMAMDHTGLPRAAVAGRDAAKPSLRRAANGEPMFPAWGEQCKRAKRLKRLGGVWEGVK